MAGAVAQDGVPAGLSASDGFVGEAPRAAKSAPAGESSHGDPSAEAQLLLEYMNRARANPSEEADRILVDYGSQSVTDAVEFFLGVTWRGPPGNQSSGTEFTRQENHDAFDGYSARPPLAFEPAITDAALAHTRLMKQNAEQSHQFDGEEVLRKRLKAAGFKGSGVAENLFAFADDMLHAHAAFAVDWGQRFDEKTRRPETGDRTNLMNPDDRTPEDFALVGIGVLREDKDETAVGPYILTVDFARSVDSNTVYVTGVVYDDANANGFYDVGEGRSGARISSQGGAAFTISSTSGGYALPVARDAGTLQIVFAGQPGTPSEHLGEQQRTVMVARENVKLDFGPPLDPPQPPSIDTTAGPLEIADGFDGRVDFDVSVADPQSPAVGCIELELTLRHADRSELLLRLESPQGTLVTLFDGAAGGADLIGSFDRSLQPVEPLTAVIGELVAGTWSLHVTEAVGGVAGGRLESATLSVFPDWVRPLHAVATSLALDSVRWKDATKPRADSLLIAGEIDPQGVLLDPSAGGRLRLLDPTSGTELMALDLDAKGGSSGAAKSDAPVVKTKFELNLRGTSRSAIQVRVKNIDLPAPEPTELRVEIALGQALVAQDVPLEGGRYKGRRSAPLASMLFIDRLKATAPEGGERSVVLKGRFSFPGGFEGVRGPVELAVGEARFKLSANNLTSRGGRLVFTSSSGLRKLVADTRKGRLTAKFTTAQELVDEGQIRVELRVGEEYFGRSELLPRESQGKLTY